ncbi:TetR family transcriptional regulator [Sphingobium sp. C100]|nr:TetR family transcriptional regulator [Sphingobium sp. C100]
MVAGGSALDCSRRRDMHGRMTTPTQRSAIRQIQANATIIDAARTVIAARGLAGMSLRTVAEQAEMSVGSISYRIGDRAALMAAVVEREIELLGQVSEDFKGRVRNVKPLSTDMLPDLVGAWLDQMAAEGRVSAIVTCELALLASRTPDILPSVPLLLDAAEVMWREMLRGHPDGERLAWAIASYCMDERPFTVALCDILDYRLLRQSTIRGLLRDAGAAVDPGWSRWHMSLVDRLAIPSADALDSADIVPQGVKADLADHIADLIVADGVDGLSHRAVAQRSGMAASSIAHHFPTHRDIVFSGVEAIYRRMRAEIRTSYGTAPGSGAVARLTHECALLATRNPAFLPFATDMRRRRAENVHTHIAEWIGIPVDSDRARIQAVIVALIGHGVAAMAKGGLTEPLPQLVRLIADVEHMS